MFQWTERSSFVIELGGLGVSMDWVVFVFHCTGRFGCFNGLGGIWFFNGLRGLGCFSGLDRYFSGQGG